MDTQLRKVLESGNGKTNVWSRKSQHLSCLSFLVNLLLLLSFIGQPCSCRTRWPWSASSTYTPTRSWRPSHSPRCLSGNCEQIIRIQELVLLNGKGKGRLCYSFFSFTRVQLWVFFIATLFKICFISNNQSWARHNFLTLRQSDNAKIREMFPPRSKMEFDTIFSSNVTDNHVLSLKRSYIVATIVACAQLYQ